MAKLTSDPYLVSSIQPTHFRIYMDAAVSPVDSPAVTNPDGSKQMSYDLTNLSVGAHTVQASAAISDVWGTSESAKAPLSPLAFTKRDANTKPVVPTGIALAA